MARLNPNPAPSATCFASRSARERRAPSPQSLSLRSSGVEHVRPPTEQDHTESRSFRRTVPSTDSGASTEDAAELCDWRDALTGMEEKDNGRTGGGNKDKDDDEDCSVDIPEAACPTTVVQYGSVWTPASICAWRDDVAAAVKAEAEAPPLTFLASPNVTIRKSSARLHVPSPNVTLRKASSKSVPNLRMRKVSATRSPTRKLKFN